MIIARAAISRCPSSPCNKITHGTTRIISNNIHTHGYDKLSAMELHLTTMVGMFPYNIL